MKVAIITDQHFGFKKGSKLFHEYFQKFYEEVFFPILQERSIDTVIDMGDTFDSRKGIDLYSLNWSQKNYFDRLRDMGIHLTSIVGNHTAYYKNTNEINTIDLILREYDNIDVISQPEERQFDKLKVLFIPWISTDEKESSHAAIKKSKCKVAMGHLELNGFYAHHGYTMDSGAEIEPFKKFTKVFSGHFHTRSNDGKIYYLGNPYEMYWNDCNDKRGFHIFDTDTLALETINNPFQMYRIIFYDDTPRQLFKFKEYKNKIVKLIVKRKSSKKEYERFVDSLSAANPYDLKIVEKIDGTGLDDTIVEQTEDTMTLLDKYVDDLETNLDRIRIKSIIKNIYQEACEVA
tara:strand:- start:730 stop:1770 length:1041 start_codon:yes stop_codon:yes gene_type:complete